MVTDSCRALQARRLEFGGLPLYRPAPFTLPGGKAALCTGYIKETDQGYGDYLFYR